MFRISKEGGEYEGPGWALFNGSVCFLPYFNDMGQAIFNCFRPNYFFQPLLLNYYH